MPDLLYPAQESLYFHNSLANVIQHTCGYVRIDWHPVLVRSFELREVYEHALQLLKQTSLSRILTDHQLLAPLMPADQHWVAHEWVPRAVEESGYSHCAVIQSYDVLNHLATLRIVRHLASPLTVSYFEDRRAAETWLLHHAG